MKKTSVIIVTLSLSAFQVVAQSGASPYAQENINAAGTATGIFQSFDNRQLEIKGSPMLRTFYSPGYLIDANDRIRKIDSLNIDVHREEVVSKNQNKYIALDKNRIKSFGIVIDTNDTLIFAIESFPKAGSVYEILQNGKIAIYKKEAKILVSQVKGGAYNTAESYSEYQQKITYYLKDLNSEVVSIKTKKDVVSTLPQFTDRIEMFFKENKISMKKESDLIKLGIFLNSL